jgi:ribosome biogenesis GTPase
MGKWHWVWDGAEIRQGFPGGRLALGGGRRKNRVAVGDRVTLRLQSDGSALIESILPRKNKLSRRLSFTGAEHVVAANVDVLAVMLAPNPLLNTALLDRYLVAALSQGMEVAVLVNKMDLLSPSEVNETLEPYRRLNYPIFPMAAKLRRDLDAFLSAVAERWVVLVGHSGVGKTTLVNAVVPGAEERVAEVREATGKGRHTTSSAIAHRLEDGTILVDTAGIREFALWEMGWREVERSFPEIHEAGAGCRFPDCQHDREPGCAVKGSLQAGRISPRRYGSYLSLLREVLGKGAEAR